MRSFLLISLALLALGGCGGSSSSTGSNSTALTDDSTCADWLAVHDSAGTQAHEAYLRSKGVEVGDGSPGDALSAWIDTLCGKDGASATSYSSLTDLGVIYAAARQRFDAGQTFPPSSAGP